MAEVKNQPLVVVMAGGSGTRFWPASQKSLPKQYLKLVGDRSLIQETVSRAELLTTSSKIFICSSEAQKPLIAEQLPHISGLILEPEPRNTAPCLMLSVDALLRKGFSLETPLVIFPADHYIGNPERFQELLKAGVDFVQNNNALLTLGITPTSPHTGYGYIETEDPSQGKVLRAKRFLEKPNLEKARSFIQNRNFFWNSGIFISTLGSLSEAFEKYQPESWNKLKKCESVEEMKRVYPTLTALPVDIAVMEKADNVFLIPAPDIHWTDLGSWGALHELMASDPSENTTLSGQVQTLDSKGCLINVDPERKVALVGVDNLVVVEKNGVILIAARSKDQLVREISKNFEASN